MGENKSKNTGAKVGAVLGGAAGAAMSTPIGRWLTLNAKDEIQLQIRNVVEDIFKSRAAGNTAYRIFSIISNTILSYPAILPIAGGLIAAGVGAIIGKKISKAKLKHKSLTPVPKKKNYSR